MFTFPVSQRWGDYLKKQGFKVIPNTVIVTGARRHRPCRLVVEASSGRDARRIFQALFWSQHKRVQDPYCDCCNYVVSTYQE